MSQQYGFIAEREKRAMLLLELEYILKERDVVKCCCCLLLK